MTSGFDVCLYGKDLNLAVVGTKTRTEAKTGAPKREEAAPAPPKRAVAVEDMPSLALVRRACFACAAVLLVLLFLSDKVFAGTARWPQALYLGTLLVAAQLLAEAAGGVFGMQMLALVYVSTYAGFLGSPSAYQLCWPYMLCAPILQMWSATQVQARGTRFALVNLLGACVFVLSVTIRYVTALNAYGLVDLMCVALNLAVYVFNLQTMHNAT